MALTGNLMSSLGLESWQRKTLLAWYVIFIAVNVVCETGMFGLPSNSDISQRFATPITPSNWTFSIWGLIFLLQGFGVTYAFFGDKNSEKGAGYALARVWTWWIYAWIGSCLFQFFFMQESKSGMLFSAIVLISVAAFSIEGSMLANEDATENMVQTISVSVASSFYAGWTVVASAVSATVVGKAFGASEDILLLASIAGLIVVISVTVLRVFVTGDNCFVIPVVWGLSGVVTKTTHPIVLKLTVFAIIFATICGIVGFAVGGIGKKKEKEAAQAAALAGAKEPFLLIKTAHV